MLCGLTSRISLLKNPCRNHNIGLCFAITVLGNCVWAGQFSFMLLFGGNSFGFSKKIAGEWETFPEPYTKTKTLSNKTDF